MPERCALIIDRLIEEGRKRGLTQRELAEAVKLPQSTIGRLEAKQHAPQLDTLIKVANALDCDIAVVSSN